MRTLVGSLLLWSLSLWLAPRIADAEPPAAPVAKLLPAIRDGKPDGFVVYRIVKGSMVEKIGLQNGDRIYRVDGRVLSGPDGALELYQRIVEGKGGTLELERRGEVKKLEARPAQ